MPLSKLGQLKSHITAVLTLGLAAGITDGILLLRFAIAEKFEIQCVQMAAADKTIVMVNFLLWLAKRVVRLAPRLF
jgi:hypothetical protein